MADQGKDLWDKIDIIMKPVGGLVTAFAIAALGFFTSNFLQERQAADAANQHRAQLSSQRIQLYTQLMSQREESESALRKDMFGTIIQSFLRPNTVDLDERVLNLELLAYNFHESLNLKPLFFHLRKLIASAQEPNKRDYLDRLERVAREITRKQLMVLEGAGKSFDRTIDFEELRSIPGGYKLEPATLTVDGIERTFKIVILEEDPKTREFRMRLEITTPLEQQEDKKTSIAEFWVGFYDFPMIDNTRLLHGQRLAVVMNSFDRYSADITVTYFPGAYASLKEKPYFQEVVNQLLGNNAPGDIKKNQLQ